MTSGFVSKCRAAGLLEDFTSYPRRVSLISPTCPRWYCRILVETGLAPLRVEIIETVIIKDIAKVLAVLSRLEAMGILTAKGKSRTEYSSLAMLHSFSFDKDRSFVGHVGKS